MDDQVSGVRMDGQARGCLRGFGVVVLEWVGR